MDETFVLAIGILNLKNNLLNNNPNDIHFLLFNTWPCLAVDVATFVVVYNATERRRR